METKPDFDIDEIWREAVQRYKKADVELEESQSYINKRSEMEKRVDDLFKAEQGLPTTEQAFSPAVESLTTDLQTFVAFRMGDGGHLNRLKHFLGRYVVTMSQIASMAGNAASQVFPPASVITVAVMHVLGAAAAVSKSRDLIQDLFDIMISFAERLLIIKKLKAVQQTDIYRQRIMKTFASMLEFCIDVRRRMKSGWKEVGRAFIGRDGGLQEAYERVVRCINRLDSATAMQTLAALDELSLEEKKRNVESVKAFKAVTDSLSMIIDMVSELKLRDRQPDDRAPKSPATRLGVLGSGSGSQRFASLAKATSCLTTGAEQHVLRRLLEMHELHVQGTFEWFDEHYGKLKAKDGGLLNIVGETGMGKTFLAFSIFVRLAADFESEGSTSVVFFAFDDQVEELRTVRNMLYCCATQITSKDNGYRKELQEFIDDNPQWTDNAWDTLFERMFLKSHPDNRRLFMVLDGLDQLDESKDLQLV